MSQSNGLMKCPKPQGGKAPSPMERKRISFEVQIEGHVNHLFIYIFLLLDKRYLFYLQERKEPVQICSIKTSDASIVHKIFLKKGLSQFSLNIRLTHGSKPGKISPKSKVTIS